MPIPTSSFPILKSQNPCIDEIYEAQKRRTTDFKAPKLWKGSSGMQKEWKVEQSSDYSYNLTFRLPGTCIWLPSIRKTEKYIRKAERFFCYNREEFLDLRLDPPLYNMTRCDIFLVHLHLRSLRLWICATVKYIFSMFSQTYSSTSLPSYHSSSV